MGQVGEAGPFADLSVVMLRRKREGVVDPVGVAAGRHHVHDTTGNGKPLGRDEKDTARLADLQ
jgi:hypothetical protein